MDVARFADTLGDLGYTPRNACPHRNCVSECFVHNNCLDRFTERQIARDLLPDASVQTRVWSPSNRLLHTTEEGGAQSKDYQQSMLTDRVSAMGAARESRTLENNSLPE